MIGTRKYQSFTAVSLADLASQLGLFARDIYTQLEAVPSSVLVTRNDVYVEPFSISFGVVAPTHIMARVRDAVNLEAVINAGSVVNWTQDGGGARIDNVQGCVIGTQYAIDFIVIGDW